MKPQPFITVLLGLVLMFTPSLFTTTTARPKPAGERYSASLVAPRAGEVLVPGRVYRIEWTSVLPDMDLSLCETELRLSLDGGRTFTWITGERDPTVKYVDWIVPNTPSRNAVIDVHFGCLGHYPETSSIQTRSAFIIDSPI